MSASLRGSDSSSSSPQPPPAAKTRSSDETHSGAAQIKTHAFFDEALRRSRLPQQVVKYTRPYSLLLPAPNNIVLELFDTLVEQITDAQVLAYVDAHLAEYLERNWASGSVQRVLTRLSRELAVEAKHNSASSAGSAANLLDLLRRSAPSDAAAVSRAAQQVRAHLMGRVRDARVGQVESLIVKLALNDALTNGHFKVHAYEDARTALEDWRGMKLIKLYAFGNAPANDQRLVLASTSQGDLTKWIANYIDGSDKRNDASLLRKLTGALRDKTRNCFYITHDVDDALRALDSAAIKCALLLDRSDRWQSMLQHVADKQQLESAMTSGKLYIISSLVCVDFAPDPDIYHGNERRQQN